MKWNLLTDDWLLTSATWLSNLYTNIQHNQQQHIYTHTHLVSADSRNIERLEKFKECVISSNSFRNSKNFSESLWFKSISMQQLLYARTRYTWASDWLSGNICISSYACWKASGRIHISKNWTYCLLLQTWHSAMKYTFQLSCLMTHVLQYIS